METVTDTINNNYRPDEKKDYYFEIDGDKIIRYKPVVDNYYSAEVVMDKETFIKAYKKWILGDGDNGEND